MRLSIATLAVLNVLSFSACRETQNPVGPLSPAESPDYAVYDAVLLGLFDNATTSDGPTRYVLIDTTSISDMAAPSEDSWLRRQFGPQLEPSLHTAFSDYKAKNGTSLPLDLTSFHVAPRIELLPRRPANSVGGTAPRNPGTYWSDFYARYPHSRGYISFSRPGYDSTRTYALLSYGHVCGGLCGDWGFVLLEHRGDRWIVLRRVVTAEA